MYNAVIIEDESHAASLLKNMLGQINPAVRVVEICHDLPSGVLSIRKNKPDVVFLDIELPVYSGIQLLDFFNPDEIGFHIIFITAFNEYAVKAFEMCALDYLMKPLQEQKLQAAVQKLALNSAAASKSLLPALQQNLTEGSNKKMVIPVHNGFEVINVHEIRFLRADGSYTHINAGTGVAYLVSKNLKHFENLLAGDPKFLRIHRSVVVNVSFIRKIQRDSGYMVLLEDKTELPLSDDKVDALLASLQSR